MTEVVVPTARKTYLEGGSRRGLRVPMREVPLTSGDTVVLYDTSGPYTDPSYEADVRRGLPRPRDAWIDERGDTGACRRHQGHVGIHPRVRRCP